MHRGPSEIIFFQVLLSSPKVGRYSVSPKHASLENAQLGMFRPLAVRCHESNYLNSLQFPRRYAVVEKIHVAEETCWSSFAQFDRKKSMYIRIRATIPQEGVQRYLFRSLNSYANRCQLLQIQSSQTTLFSNSMPASAPFFFQDKRGTNRRSCSLGLAFTINDTNSMSHESCIPFLQICRHEVRTVLQGYPVSREIHNSTYEWAHIWNVVEV